MKKTNKSLSLILATFMSAQVLATTACELPFGSKENKIETYDVNVSASTGGSITVDTTEVEQGKDVTFTLTIDDGYVLDSLVINGGEVVVTDNKYVFSGVICDLDVKANFVKPEVTVLFDADGVEVPSIELAKGDVFGELPTVSKVGKKFLYWVNEKGIQVRPTTVANKAGEVTLTAVWEDLTEKDREALKPFGATTAYYDAAATKYGVVFHTEAEPITPQILLAKNANGDFTDATVFDCDYEPWFDEYVINGVVDGLDFETTYSVKFGDYSADKWSKTYTFTTRKEQVEEANFYYFTDSQETYLIEDKTESTYLGTTYWDATMSHALMKFPEVDFVTHGGDIVNHGAETACWQEMFDSVEEILFQYPLMVSPGNHEGDGWYSAGYECVGKMFNIDVISNTEMGFFYSFDYGPLHYVSFLSNDIFYKYDGNYTQEQLDWLKADLAKAKENENLKWTVLTMHQGILIPTSVVGEMTSNNFAPLTYPQLMPILDEFDVDLVLYGHNHYLDSTYPVTWSNVIEFSGYDNYMEQVVDYYRVDLATKETKKTEYDGDQVDEFVYADGVTNRGTVMHQIGCAGDQYNTRYMLADLEQNLANAKYYRMLLSGGKGAIDDESGYSMYSYVEVTADKLVCRTYGVNAKAQVASPSLENGKCIDGFMLRK